MDTIYSEKVRRMAGTWQLVSGAALITTGAIGGAFWGGITLMGIVGLAFAIVAVVALWLLVGWSASGREGLFSLGVLLLRILTILGLLLVGLLGALAAIHVLGMYMSGFAAVVLLGLIVGTVYVLVRCFFLAFLRILRGLEEGVFHNQPLRNEGFSSFFTVVLTFVVVSIYSDFAAMAGTYTPETTVPQQPFRIDLFGGIIPAFDNIGVYTAHVSPFIFDPGVFFTIAAGLGVILCMWCLRRIHKLQA
jgi:hypothetical protein